MPRTVFACAMAVALGACSSAPAAGGVPHVTAMQLCGDRSFDDREVWLEGPLDPSSILPLALDGTMIRCDAGTCCATALYVSGFVCNTERAVIVAPMRTIFPASAGIDTVQESALLCVGTTDGSMLGGEACRPTDCATRPAPNFTHVAAVRGVLQSVPTRFDSSPDPRVGPIYAFVVQEVRLSDTAGGAGPDASIGPDTAL